MKFPMKEEVLINIRKSLNRSLFNFKENCISTTAHYIKGNMNSFSVT